MTRSFTRRIDKNTRQRFRPLRREPKKTVVILVVLSFFSTIEGPNPSTWLIYDLVRGLYKTPMVKLWYNQDSCCTYNIALDRTPETIGFVRIYKTTRITCLKLIFSNSSPSLLLVVARLFYFVLTYQPLLFYHLRKNWILYIQTK